MSLRERGGQFREERALSQGELAENIGRCESGRPPSPAVRLAEIFGASADYLHVEGAPRRPSRVHEDSLGDRLPTVRECGDQARELAFNSTDDLVTKSRLGTLADGIG